MSLLNQNLKDIHSKLHNKELSVLELVEETFRAISERDERIGAYLTLNEEGAKNTAAASTTNWRRERNADFCSACRPASRTTS